MKFIIEANIPYIRGVFEPYAEVEYLAPAEFTKESVHYADALIVRTRTRCCADLLADSKVKFIGTATIGTDHIDLDWCAGAGITVCSAPGCNAPAVAQYVLATIGQFMSAENITDASSLTLGIVGVGHVGSIIAHWADAIGFNVMRNDIPGHCNDAGKYYSIDEIASQADIITFHTPLIKQGKYSTWHLADTAFIKSLAKCKLLINSARGGILDNQAVEAAVRNNISTKFAIDCWENEPTINRYLLENVFVATPHIAGYSAQGKARATDMMIDAVSKFFNLPLPHKSIDMGNTGTPALDEIVCSYNPLTDTAELRSNPEKFEELRNHYNLRNEVNRH